MSSTLDCSAYCTNYALVLHLTTNTSPKVLDAYLGKCHLIAEEVEVGRIILVVWSSGRAEVGLVGILCPLLRAWCDLEGCFCHQMWVVESILGRPCTGYCVSECAVDVV